ncbi:MAG: type I-C CRISPR-associated protein Cas8c/Csd1, partial [Rhodobacteraceae bacterium]|nr:type I-C CRISPR-associated protein Cas8c/Csd1 [Paracoccaceae bacterium]
GETTFVFWTSSADIHTNEKATSIFAELVNPSDMEKISDSNIKSYLQAIRRGVALNVPELNQETRFFVLGLSPNKSRIFIRIFWEGHFDNLINNFQKYFDEMKISANDTNILSIWGIVKNLAVQNKSKNIIPRLAGELLGSILTGKDYPISLLTNSVIRIRADGKVSTPRVAVMKAILIRNFNRKVPMTLDKNFSNRGYVLGRLFSVYEEIQIEALGNVNASIKDKYYGLASSSPQQAFRTLEVGTQHHLAKIRKLKPGLAIYLEKRIGSIMELMVPDKEPIPISLNLLEQAMFGVGYYHQRNNSFQKNENISQIDEVSND